MTNWSLVSAHATVNVASVAKPSTQAATRLLDAVAEVRSRRHALSEQEALRVCVPRRRIANGDSGDMGAMPIHVCRRNPSCLVHEERHATRQVRVHSGIVMRVHPTIANTHDHPHPTQSKTGESGLIARDRCSVGRCCPIEVFRQGLPSWGFLPNPPKRYTSAIRARGRAGGEPGLRPE